jgi:1-acyl-sn-glycerol-3-phosphate acyltransferase
MTIQQRVARRILRMVGWRTEGEPPEQQRYVLIAAPHTSNWDFPLMLLMAIRFRVPIHWLGKESLFRPPAGWLLRRLGGVPVRRGEPSQLVAQMAGVFADRAVFVLAVPPCATRSYSDHWKSGFYRIAEAASVPVVCSYLDYATKIGGFGPAIVPSSDVRADMDVVRAFYAGKQGRYPDQVSEIRLRDEAA